MTCDYLVPSLCSTVFLCVYCTVDNSNKQLFMRSYLWPYFAETLLHLIYYIFKIQIYLKCLCFSYCLVIWTPCKHPFYYCVRYIEHIPLSYMRRTGSHDSPYCPYIWWFKFYLVGCLEQSFLAYLKRFSQQLNIKFG